MKRIEEIERLSLEDNTSDALFISERVASAILFPLFILSDIIPKTLSTSA